MIGAIVAGAFVALVAANFAYLYPILTDQLLPYRAWLVPNVVPELDLELATEHLARRTSSLPRLDRRPARSFDAGS